MRPPTPPPLDVQFSTRPVRDNSIGTLDVQVNYLRATLSLQIVGICTHREIGFSTRGGGGGSEPPQNWGVWEKG